MRDNILRYLRENELIAPGATLVCAVSGGKDSVCLLHMMLSLQDELQITVEAAHLNLQRLPRHRHDPLDYDRHDRPHRHHCAGGHRLSRPQFHGRGQGGASY